MDSACVIADLKKRLQGQTMELEKLRKEGKGELVLSLCPLLQTFYL